MSPVTLTYNPANSCESADHRDFSPPSPLMSSSARFSCVAHLVTEAWRSPFFLFAASRPSWRAASLSCTALRAASLPAKASEASLSDVSAAFRASFLGPTFFATAS